MQYSKLWAALLVAALGAGGAVADEGGTSSFTFKRVKPPVSGAKKLITIHVPPPAVTTRALDHVIELPELRERKEAPKAPVDVATSDRWFWGAMSPRVADAGYGKLAKAMRVLEKNPDEVAKITPSDAVIQQIVSSYGAEILKATLGTEISPALVVAVIATESAGKAAAKSSAGARGLMQLMPATAERFGVKKLNDPAENIGGGVKYLSFLLNRFKGDALLALAAYNAGEGAVDRYEGVPEFKETRGYVPKVVAAWASARQTCLRPPERATDGCLFATLRVASE